MSKKEDWEELEKWQYEYDLKNNVNKVKAFNEEDFKGIKKFSDGLNKFVKTLSIIAIIVGSIVCIIVILYLYSIFTSPSFFDIRVTKGGMF